MTFHCVDYQYIEQLVYSIACLFCHYLYALLTETYKIAMKISRHKLPT